MASPISYKFVDKVPEDHQCTICTNILTDPVLTGCCGQHFCEACLYTWLDTESREYCPHCRNEDMEYIQSLHMKRNVNKLKIYCPNQSKGCEHITTLGECEKHLETKCVFEDVSCTLKCGERMPRQELGNHENNQCSHRHVTCSYCETIVMHKNINTKSHFEKCPGYPLPCPNDCGQKDIQRSLIEAHRQVCPLELVQCPFSEAGCGDVPRKDLDTHIASSTQQHLALVMTTMITTKKNL